MADSYIKNKFLYLLLSLLMFFILNPFLTNTRVNFLVFSICFVIVLLLSIYSIMHNKKVVIVAGLFAALVLIGQALVIASKSRQEIQLFDYLMVIIFFFIITITTIHHIIRDKIITANTIYGAISAYLLIGLSWTFIYVSIFTLNNQAFYVPELPDQLISTKSHEFIYYSFVTLSTLGYGDVVPITNVARTFSWLEAILGQIYLTVWIAHLVGLYVAQRGK